MTDNSPQLGGQASDNAPMISGRGTKIIVSARGAYEARNLPALFDAMSPDQQILFRQAAVREMLAHLRPAAEQAAESQPAIYDTLSALDAWLASNAPVAEGITNPTDPPFADLPPIERRVRILVDASRTRDHTSIEYAIFSRVYEYVYDDIPQQPHILIMKSELDDWIFEAGWAILNGHNAPPLHLDAARIEALIADTESWYRKQNLPVLITLMRGDQPEQFKQAVRHQAMWYIDSVPTDLWKAEYLRLFELARGWLADPTTLTAASLYAASKPFRENLISPLRGLVGAFDDHISNPYEQALSCADSVLSLTTNVTWMLKGTRHYDTHQERADARLWQVEAAYAILTDQPIPPLATPAEQ